MKSKFPLLFAVFFLLTGFTVQNLGTLPGGGLSVALAINNRGNVSGFAFNSAGVQRAMWWKPATNSYLEIPTPLIAGSITEATDLNDYDVVVGRMGTSISPNHAFIWCPGCALFDFGGTSTQESRAFGINNAYDVVGQWVTPGSPSFVDAVKWPGASSTRVAMPGLGGRLDWADQPAEYPRIVGTSAGTGTPRLRRAVLWEGKKVINLGTLGGANSFGRALVVRSWPDPYFTQTFAVGESEYPGGGMDVRAFLWTAWTLTDLGTLPGWSGSRAYGINKRVHVVGEAWDSPFGGVHHAVLWDDTGIHDLNDLISDPDWVLTNAYDINDAGQIVGYGSYRGTGRAFLLTP
jgi:probable HAF family extracellular repeat protein